MFAKVDGMWRETRGYFKRKWYIWLYLVRHGECDWTIRVTTALSAVGRLATDFLLGRPSLQVDSTDPSEQHCLLPVNAGHFLGVYSESRPQGAVPTTFWQTRNPYFPPPVLPKLGIYKYLARIAVLSGTVFAQSCSLQSSHLPSSLSSMVRRKNISSRVG